MKLKADLDTYPVNTRVFLDKPGIWLIEYDLREVMTTGADQRFTSRLLEHIDQEMIDAGNNWVQPPQGTCFGVRFYYLGP